MAKTVLVVDDSPTMRQMVAFTLTSAGYQVVEAGNGKEAVGKVNGGAKPDLVVTDLNMPEMDGITFVKTVKQHPSYRFTPILMLTTESDAGKKQEGQAAGAKAWMLKPFQPEQMLGAVQKLCLP